MICSFRTLTSVLAITILAQTMPALAQNASSPDTLAEADALDTGMGAELYFYVTRPTGSFEEVVEILPAHMDFIHTIENAGVMVMGGQTTIEGSADAGGYGLVVIRAGSFEEARDIAESDPMHLTGVREFELYRWNINEGFTTIELRFSDQSFVIK
ncbi:MAG: YciI family protein [Pseudomonadota bacterium]